MMGYYRLTKIVHLIAIRPDKAGSVNQQIGQTVIEKIKNMDSLKLLKNIALKIQII